MDIRSKELDDALQRANRKSKEKTVRGVQEKQVDPNEIMFNTEKVGKLVAKIMDSRKVKKKLDKIINARRPTDLNQDSTMKFLYTLNLVVGNGQRGNTISLMKIKEFDDAKNSKEAIKVIFCAEHKTTVSSRPAPVVFPFPDVFRAVDNYINLYR